MARLGSIEVFPPEVVGVVDRVLPRDDLKSLSASGLRVLEFRFDSFKEPPGEVIAFARQARSTFAILGTMRETETNRGNLKESYAEFIDVVDCVDIEIATTEPLRSALVSIVRNASKQLMISHHDFTKVPSREELNQTLEKARQLNPDFIKFAIAAQDDDQVKSLMRFLLDHVSDGIPLSIFAMGEVGMITRVSAGMLGSLFTYGYLTSPNAPGQLSAMELLALKKKLYQH
ncbi:MAG: type I 3-dehydroquinate dehydratase [Spirochaetia bacterium]|nr:type I 3-dehydroquinate dehydratase [Spirochaetia bacterium]